MRFDRAFVTNSICGPSRAVIMTGKYSHLNGFPDNSGSAWFNGSQTTAPRLLQANGYATAVIGKWHLNSDPIGFDYWHILIGQGPYYNPRMKTGDGFVGCLVRMQQLDGRRAPQEPMPSTIDHAHSSLAQFFLELILAQLFGLQCGLLGRFVNAIDSDREHED